MLTYINIKLKMNVRENGIIGGLSGVLNTLFCSPVIPLFVPLSNFFRYFWLSLQEFQRWFEEDSKTV